MTLEIRGSTRSCYMSRQSDNSFKVTSLAEDPISTHGDGYPVANGIYGFKLIVSTYSCAVVLATIKLHG